jgi:glycosyltransferase involved in cell wall biosynthesis
MNVVFVSHSSFNENLMVGSLHLARSMAALGHSVLHVGPPVTPFHRLHPANREYRDRLARAISDPSEREGMIAFEPFALIPWQVARTFLSRENLFFLSSNIGQKIMEVFPPGDVDLLLVDDPRLAGVGKSLRPRAFYYRPTDLYAEMKGDPAIITAERQILSRCTGVIATSEPVRQHALTLRPGLPSLLLENGVDYEHFSTPMAEPAELKDIPHPRVVYVGAIDDRFDHALVDFLAGSFPDVHFILIGPGTREIQVAARGNLHLLGPKPYLRIPGFLQFSEVGLLPLVDNLANSGRSPMKLYEYGAAGLPVLATRTSELQRRDQDFVHLFSEPQEAVRQLRKLLKNQPDRRQIAESCRAHGWANKVTALLEFAWLHVRREKLPLAVGVP